MAKRKDERSWSSLDDVDYDEDGEGANPVPDDDGHVILKRKEAANGGRPDHGNGKAAGSVAPRRTRTNARTKASKRG